MPTSIRLYTVLCLYVLIQKYLSSWLNSTVVKKTSGSFLIIETNFGAHFWLVLYWSNLIRFNGLNQWFWSESYHKWTPWLGCHWISDQPVLWVNFFRVILFTLYGLFIYGTYYVTFCETSSWIIWTQCTCSAEIWTKLFTMWGWNGKVFYLLLYSIVLRTLLLSILKFHSLTTF